MAVWIEGKDPTRPPQWVMCANREGWALQVAHNRARIWLYATDELSARVWLAAHPDLCMTTLFQHDGSTWRQLETEVLYGADNN